MFNNTTAPHVASREYTAFPWFEARRQYAARLLVRVAHANLQKAIAAAQQLIADASIEDKLDVVGNAATRIGSLDYASGMHFPPSQFEHSKFLLDAWEIGYCRAAGCDIGDEHSACVRRDPVIDAALAELGPLCNCALAA